MKKIAPIRSLEALVQGGMMTPGEKEALMPVGRRYAIRVPEAIASHIAISGKQGALGRQYLPSRSELVGRFPERKDPIGDQKFSPLKGIIHRYPDRVLLQAIRVCPVYCRFCFRREFVGPGRGSLTGEELASALSYIRRQRQIWEVILSGGDPFMMGARYLGKIIASLDSIPHVNVIRLHTRVPVADPERMTPSLLRALQTRNTPVYIAIHANHPDEFSLPARHVCAKLATAGMVLLGQSVLLKGINDEAHILETLFRTMVRHRIKPYYLHHLDYAPGTSHFRVGITRGQELMRRLRGRLSGLCQPTYVLDIPGGYGKVPIGPVYTASRHTKGVESWRILDYKGHSHQYPPANKTARSD